MKPVCPGKPGDGKCIVGIKRDGFAEVPLCLVVAVDIDDAPLGKQFPAAQIGVVGLGIACPPKVDGGLFVGSQVNFERFDYVARYLVLNGKHIGHRAVITLCPHVPAAGHVDKLRIDSHTVAGSAHGAFENELHTECLAYFGNVDTVAPGTERTNSWR